jgi:hypothetical protein
MQTCSPRTPEVSDLGDRVPTQVVSTGAAHLLVLDVFADAPLTGNPLAVVAQIEGEWIRPSRRSPWVKPPLKRDAMSLKARF